MVHTISKNTKMIKKTLLILFLGVSYMGYAQSSNYYTKKGYAAAGYDVVAYFSDVAAKGDAQYTTTDDGIKYKFKSQANLDKFIANPDKYKPQYGGYCAYGIAVANKKVSIDPETYEIRDGKLYLFYKSGGTDTLELWKEKSPETLRAKADVNWEKIKS